MSLVEKLKKRGGFWVNYSCSGVLGLEKRFSDTKPTEKAVFISLREIEEKYGKIIAVKLDDEEDGAFTIWTEKYILKIIVEDEACEYLLSIPRDPSHDAEVF